MPEQFDVDHFWWVKFDVDHFWGVKFDVDHLYATIKPKAISNGTQKNYSIFYTKIK